VFVVGVVHGLLVQQSVQAGAELELPQVLHQELQVFFAE
jgi:hypothetical protein